MMCVMIEIGEEMLNVLSGYEPQVGCELRELEGVIERIPRGERVVMGADFSGHVGEGNRGEEEVMGRFGFKDSNLEEQAVVDFGKRIEMAVVNTYFQRGEEYRVTYKSGGRSTQTHAGKSNVVRTLGGK